MTFSKITAYAFAAVLSAFVADVAHAQATRTWVSGVGDDVNPCSRTAPCKTFAGAISKTAINGEINCIDSGGFGALTVTKSITIDCGGSFGSILAAGTNGIVVNAANAVVTIRNVSINGNNTGLSGIRFIQGAALRVENVQIYNFTDKGVDFTPTTNAELMVTRSDIYNNGTGITNFAINVRPTGAASVIATIDQTTVQNNSNGVNFDSSATSAIMGATVIDTKIVGNTNAGITAKAVPSVFVTLMRTTSSFNGTGITADGANAGVQVANSNVTGNSTGINRINGGLVASNLTNLLVGNLSVNGTPSSSGPAQ